MTKTSSVHSSQSQDRSLSLGVACMALVITLDNSDDNIMNIATLSKAKNANAQIQSILNYHGDENPKDIDVQQAMLKSFVSNTLSKNVSAREILWTPEKLLVFSMVWINIEMTCRKLPCVLILLEFYALN